MANIKWVLGDGSNIRFWKDIWLGNEPLIHLAKANLNEDQLDEKVCDFISDDGDWNWPKIGSVLSTRGCMKLASQLSPGYGHNNDKVAWRHSKDNDFSVSSAYDFLGNNFRQNEPKIWKAIWGWCGPQRIKSCLWLATSGKLLTNLERSKRNLTDITSCPRCDAVNETITHTLRDCPAVKCVWDKFLVNNDAADFFSGDVRQWMLHNLSSK